MKLPDSIENYRIVRELGRGGMGVVYEGEHREFRSRVAIKLLHPRLAHDPQVLARFRLEAIAANVPQHPGIARVLGGNVLPDGGVPYIVMEYLDGKTLRKLLKKSPLGLPEPVAVRFGKQIADALAAAHAKKIIHRDVKPENIMIVRDDAVFGGERAKVLDFGIAAVAQEMAYSESQTDTQVKTSPFGGLVGTAAYMSPEQCHRVGDAPIDDKADVYALGAVLYEMLTGQPPFVADEEVSVMHMKLHEAPASVRQKLPQATPELDDLVLRMLSRAPDRRPSMREVSASLAQIDPSIMHSLPLIPPQRPRPLWIGAALLLFAGLLTIWWRASPSSRSTDISWHLDSQPRGALVIGPDGKLLGMTPWERRQSRDLGRFIVELRLTGHQTVPVVLDHSQDERKQVTLKPVSSPP